MANRIVSQKKSRTFFTVHTELLCFLQVHTNMRNMLRRVIPRSIRESRCAVRRPRITLQCVLQLLDFSQVFRRTESLIAYGNRTINADNMYMYHAIDLLFVIVAVIVGQALGFTSWVYCRFRCLEQMLYCRVKDWYTVCGVLRMRLNFFLSSLCVSWARLQSF